MDLSYCSPLQLQEDASSYLFDCDALLDKSYDALAYDPSSDPGYFSACSSLSPTSSVDSFCFSPNSRQVKTEQDPLDCFIFSSAPAPQQTPMILPKSSSTTSATKKSRSRYPGKKRQTASEREKLRMRDLTKALHHLRSYLPASVAPSGQTLTKIDTLRLTIRYISHLSAQLGLNEEVLEQRKSSGCVEQPSAVSQTLDQPMCTYGPLQETPCINTMQSACSSAYMSPLSVPNGLCYTTQQYWMPQQQYSHMGFSGQC